MQRQRVRLDAKCFLSYEQVVVDSNELFGFVDHFIFNS